MENRYTKIFFLIATAITLSIQLRSQQSLFIRTEKSGLVPDKFDSAVTAKSNVLINIPLLTSPNNILLTVLLPDTTQITIRRRRVETDKNQLLSWYGEINDQRGSLVTFSIRNNILAGTIRNNKGIVYRIIYKGDSVYRVFKIDPSLIPPELPMGFPPPPDDTSQFEEPYCTDSPEIIDLMVVYTDEVLRTAGTLGFNRDALEMQIIDWVNNANISYMNSGITHRLHCVHMQEIPYVEINDHTSETLNKLTTSGDGFLDDAHSLRDIHVADIVILLVNQSFASGLSNVLTNVSGASANRAFGVVRWDLSASATFSFSHEIGHLMGARHDCATAVAETNAELPDPNLPYVFAHGYYGSTWSTMMAIRDGIRRRDPVWSNPNLSHLGETMGSSDPACGANNARTLNTTASIVSKFRCSSPLISNVWMRDTWDDTGLEPDPNTVGQLMCLSPYIWVRNERDVGYVHQHDHQNPVSGAPNFIYVKLHNGGPTITGNLEVYIANASTMLRWPVDWTQIATRSITLNNLTTSIIEFEWTAGPVTGHYCMMARWVASTDPMTFPETDDINQNTRQNNNIIWRNMNIVDLSIAGLITVVFEIERKTENPMLLEFSDSALFPHEPFYKKGRVIITLDSLTFNAWKKGGSISSGLKRDGKRFLLTSPNASMANIMLSPKYKGKIKIEFKKKKETEKDKYFFVVAQYEQNLIKKANEKKANRKFAGAVGYEIYTYEKK
jgi:hypothetical protein